MSKIALITDTHYGVRGDSQRFHEYSREFFSNTFFPYLDEHQIQTVVHLGDVVDRRKYINFLTSNALHETLIRPLMDRKVETHVILGNHDVTYKNTNSVNAMRELYGNSKYKKLHVYENSQEVDLHGLNVLLIPWICQDNYDDTMEKILKTSAQVAFGHLELSGFEMDRGHINEHGMDKGIFDKFDVVCSGHYHHKSTVGNINYLGSVGQQTWADYDDDRGFHVFDTETRDLEFVKNPVTVFKKFFYDDQKKSAEEMMDFDAEVFKDRYVKVIVKNKTDAFLFDRVMTKIEAVGVADIQSVEDHLNLDMIDDEEILDEAQDTVTLLKKYVSQVEMKVDKKKVEKFLQDLYSEALTVE